MPSIHLPTPTHRACSWCATEFPVVHRPGRPRLYCGHSCRQRAYEHRHGLHHPRTPIELPGQHHGDHWRFTGYERGGHPLNGQHVHALRTSVRPDGHRRETLCGLLARPAGDHFNPVHPQACRTCRRITEANPLRYGINASNELSRIRSLLDEAKERRLEPAATLRWIIANDPDPVRAGQRTNQAIT